MDRFADQALHAALGLSYSNFLVLMAIDCISQEGQASIKASQKKVADFLHVTQAAISRQIDTMLGMGLLSREFNSDNRREYLLSVTKHGHEILEKAYKILGKGADDFFNVLTAQEVKTLGKLLDKVTTSIHPLFQRLQDKKTHLP